MNFRHVLGCDAVGVFATTLKDVKLHFHQAKSKTTTLLIQFNWSGS